VRSQHTILVVDDHRPSLYATSKMLQHAGFAVLEAGSGEEALLLADNASALLLDVNLPDLNGVAVCQRIKSTSTKPIVLMSAVYVDALHRDAGLAAGADLYLAPPPGGEELARIFDALLATGAA
jgi:DNA-binding response OmpR family regulator